MSVNFLCVLNNKPILSEISAVFSRESINLHNTVQVAIRRREILFYWQKPVVGWNNAYAGNDGVFISHDGCVVRRR